MTDQLIGQDLSAAFASADVSVVPSDSETLGFAVLEAMASILIATAISSRLLRCYFLIE